MTLQTVETSLTVVENTCNNGALTVATGLFSEEMKARFLAYMDVSPASARTYGRSVSRYLSFLLETGLNPTDRNTIIAFRDRLTTDGKKPTTVQTYLTSVRLFYRWLQTEGAVSADVADHIKSPRLSKAHKKDALTPAQVKQVLSNVDRQTVEGRRNYAILLLMVCCGLRTIEVIRANVEDLRTTGGHCVLYVQGKGRTERTDFVRLPEVVESAIRASLQDRKGAEPTAPLFASLSHRNTGARLTTRSISGIAKEAFRHVGIDSERVTAHSLRHTAVTLALLNGVRLEEVQAFARHANIATTQIYAHNLDALSNQSENAIVSALF